MYDLSLSDTQILLKKLEDARFNQREFARQGNTYASLKWANYARPLVNIANQVISEWREYVNQNPGTYLETIVAGWEKRLEACRQ